MKKNRENDVSGFKRGIQKLLLIMKLTSFLVLLFTLSVTAGVYSQNTKLDLSLENASIEQVLLNIENHSRFIFIYESGTIDKSIKRSISVKGQSIESILTQLLEGTDVSYSIDDRQVLLYKKDSPSGSLMDFGSYGVMQQKLITGRVTDVSGTPLPGVTVVVKGTTQGTITDAEGNYSIKEAIDKATLIFSFVGMKTKEVVAAGKTSINVTMEEEAIGIEEVVAVGYGTQKKMNVIGSVSTINSKIIESRPVTTLSSALSGLASGVYVRNTTGKPGADGASILIRGTGTLNSTSPLVVVDGIVGSMDAVNPSDVENISVLKDAATAAIYGSLASNGVILITTKKGSKEKTTISYSGSTSITEPSNLPVFVTDYVKHMRLVNEGYSNIGQAPVYTAATIALWENANAHPNELNSIGVPNNVAYPNTNWSKEVFRNKLLQNHNISLNGGNENTQYLLSTGYLNNPGTMPNTGSDKYQVRINLQSKVAKFLTLGTQTFGSIQNSSVADLGTVFSYLKATVPGVYPKYNGNYGYPSAAEESATANNPLASLYSIGGNNSVTRFSTTLFSILDIAKGLKMESKAHYDYSYTENNNHPVPQERWNFATNIIGNSAASPSQLTTQYSLYKSYNVILDNILRYNATIAEKHDIGALAGYNQQYFNLYNFAASKKGLLDASMTTLNTATTLNSITGDEYDYALRSYFGRLNYAFNQRYLFEAVLRYDGSSRFSNDNRWGFFPAFSGGWRISEEPFMQNINKYVENLKLRASWGRTGNNASGNYDYQASYNTTPYSYNGSPVSGLAQTKSANPNLKWETTTTTNLGLSGTTLRGALNFEIDVYNGFTEGILFVPTVPITVGTATAATKNIAQVTKKGIELSLVYNGHAGDFKYNVSGNLAYNYNRVKKYKGILQEGYTTDANGAQVYASNLGLVSTGSTQRIIEGHRINEYYLYPIYHGNGTYTNKDGSVNKDGGPKDGMIRTQQDMDWLQMMVNAGYNFQPAGGIGKSKIWYGDLLYADSNNDGIYGSTYDQKFTGKNSTPSWNYGVNFNFSYKGFDMSMIWAGSAGMSYYWSTTYMNQSIVALGKAVPSLIADDHYYYNEANPSDLANNINAYYPRLKTTDAQNTRASNYYLYNASYLKLKNLQLGYTIPARITKKAAMSNVRIYVGGENLLTLTKYPGIDPEIGADLDYPTMRQYTLGLNVIF